MRVALMNPWYWPEVRRGSERLLHDLAGDLLALGHEPRLIVGASSSSRTVEEGVPVVRDTSRRARLREARAADVVVAAHIDDVADCGRPLVWALMGLPREQDVAGRRREVNRALRAADAVVVLSEAARTAARDVLGVDVHVIRPGVDLEAFTPGGARAAEPTVACLADAREPRKRVDLLVAAAEALGVRLLLPPPDAPVLPAYREAWVTVLPSEHEAFGLVLLESLACGTPVVGRRDGGIPEIVASDAYGRLFDRDEDLPQALRGALELRDAAACRARAEEFPRAACARGYVGLLNTLL